ncbi:von Willebrand factor A domain-containing protein 5A-like isoform X3 [Oreochromis aureus]|uniref:von Willebrand factor A domain-containing protein 5A-like isoform X3 n=1 Tax=Oreochromis aureus TaxID=47969 RepID=UPI00195408FB|nr:von Willebrand factor A domain-containing protein 5A-like isoform X3 [Oreochromis aureus]
MPFLIATDYVGCTLNPYQNCEGYMDADQESGDYMNCALPLDQDYEAAVPEQQTRDPLLQTRDPLLQTRDPLLQTRDPLLQTRDPLLQTRDPLLQLVSLQEATGKWLLDPALPTALGKTNEEVEKSKPVLANKEIWATILALIWLHGLKMDSKNEWDLLAMKAASWLRAQNAPWVTECVEAANLLLGCSVTKEALGL